MNLHLHGRLSSFKDEQLPTLLHLLDQIENWSRGRVEADNLAANAITTAKIANGAVTSVKVAEGVGLVASGQYVGLATPDRTIAVGFRPKYVQVLRHDNSTIFEAIGNASSAFAAFWRTSAGVIGTGVADWQGIVPTGFKVGSGAGGGTSDAVGQTFSWVAYR